jgi:hypothetical protein
VTAEEVEQKALDATADKILRDLEGFLQSAYSIYDVAKAIPHPYDAIGDMGQRFLHDFRGFAFTLETYVESTRPKPEPEVPEIEWEYGFYDTDDHQSPARVYWSTFGGPVGFDTPESAAGTASKSVTGQAVIVRRPKGSDGGWHIYQKEA